MSILAGIFNSFREEADYFCEHFLDNLPSNLIDMGDPPEDTCFHEAMAQDYHNRCGEPISDRRAYIEACRAARNGK